MGEMLAQARKKEQKGNQWEGLSHLPKDVVWGSDVCQGLASHCYPQKGGGDVLGRFNMTGVPYREGRDARFKLLLRT